MFIKQFILLSLAVIVSCSKVAALPKFGDGRRAQKLGARIAGGGVAAGVSIAATTGAPTGGAGLIAGAAVAATGAVVGGVTYGIGKGLQRLSNWRNNRNK